MIDRILEDIKPRRKVLILTHNNPDPDTIAAATGLRFILSERLKKRCTVAFHGIVGRAENRELLRMCKIEMHSSMKLNFARYDYLIVVDTQPKAGNVYIPEGFKADVVIDHHNYRNSTAEIRINDVRPDAGSTSTIITEYMKHLSIIPDTDTATALYYGIKTDTVGSGRTSTCTDKAMMSYIFPYISHKKLTKIENPEVPRYYFKNLKKAVECSEIIDNLIFCDLGEVRNADLIAETSDFLLRMRDIKWTFVVGRIDNAGYFSLRSKSIRTAVGRMAISLVKGLGTGGGHMKSAGGQLNLTDRDYQEVISIIKERLLKKIGITNAEIKKI
ncbi:DHH family phosphoesterase [Seleniivibrio woodruffii]|uniref:NanoRNase/pAp phosphatase (C-di-AMP/oligoRNAs hydrolase) n=1 Tax=Seleniivibrio woodruffii TaxID=1078050 RepID=A0A4R1K2T6_9BACT|nr:DHH family phosphoesterase [Seleniivibrio woodruffii]TCK58355.1 nanoRNase/pAp phosphatase (c-di-AMP/oligoRNAs hydrolase) [Seleniivibrio woodruffii]TVZ36729.1 nanoRNase/pAp phosphatase (c-di-AMP/oligoRNAs hydrolase) [Seleniivibrio woodruffii]